MARSKRRTAPRRPRERADWVYRDNIYNAAGPDEFLGTYTPRGTSVLAGAEFAAGKILYDSKGYINPGRQGPVGVQHPVSAASRAEGGKAKILAVQGVIHFVPGTWVLGSQALVGFRIGLFDQSPDTGNIQVNAAYSMWDENLDVSTNPAIWANRPFLWERRFFRRFATGNEMTAWMMPVSFRTRRTLRPDQALALYVEVPSAGGGLGAGVTVTIVPWLRTLVVDEG